MKAKDIKNAITGLSDNTKVIIIGNYREEEDVIFYSDSRKAIIIGKGNYEETEEEGMECQECGGEYITRIASNNEIYTYCPDCGHQKGE